MTPAGAETVDPVDIGPLSACPHHSAGLPSLRYQTGVRQV